jgi:ATPase subunit of ABC transporter with duplicated ATPase domains
MANLDFLGIQESIDSLATAIKEFSGGVVIVSHDFRMSLHFSAKDSY